MIFQSSKLHGALEMKRSFLNMKKEEESVQKSGLILFTESEIILNVLVVVCMQCIQKKS